MRLFLPSLFLLSTSMTSFADTIKIVTDIAPVHSLVTQVAGDDAEVALLLEQDADAHHYSLKPSHAKSLQNADLVFWIGSELTPWLDKGIDNLAGNAHVISLLHLEGTYHLEASEDGHDHGHNDLSEHSEEKHDDHDHEEHAEDKHDDHNHDEHAEDKHDDHDHEEHAEHDAHKDGMAIDAHAWLDPVNAQLWLKAIAEELSEVNPSNAETYQANAIAASESISAVMEEIHDGMGLPHDIPAILSHDFLGYFEGRFDIHEIETLRSFDDEALGLASLTEAKQEAKEGGLSCLIYSSDEAPENFASFNEGLDLKLIAIDPLGAQQPIGPALYTGTLRGIATALNTCLD